MAISAPAARAAGFTWLGNGVTDNWTNTFNWFDLQPPGNSGTDDAIFNGVNSRTTTNLNQSYSLRGIFIEEGPTGQTDSFTFNRSNNSVLTVRTIISNATTRSQTFNVPIILSNEAAIENTDRDGDTGGGSIDFNEPITMGNNPLNIEAKGGSTIRFNDAISGNAPFRKYGDGTVRLGTSNNITGRIQISGGTLEFSAGNQLGATTNYIAFTQAGGSAPTLRRTTAGTTVLPVEIDIDTEARFHADAAWTHTGSLTSEANLTSAFGKTGGGTLTLTGSLLYGGATRVHEGELVLSGATRLPDTRVTINTGAKLTYPANATETIGSLNGGGTLAIGSGPFTIGVAGSTESDTNGSGSFSGRITGAGYIEARGTGTLVLSGSASDYSGGTVVHSGASVVADNSAGGSATGTGFVHVVDGARLAGDGSVSGRVSVYPGGLISPTNGGTPGGGIGSLGVNNIDVAAGGIVRIEINGITAGVSVDQLNVAGEANLAGGILDLKQLPGFDPSAGAFAPIKIITLGGTRTGIFGSVLGNMINNLQALAVTYESDGIFVSLARPGDATLDGRVNFADLVALAQNYNQSGRSWTTGDFNGTGTTNFADLVALAQNYNTSVSAAQLDAIGASAAFAEDWALAQALVPEPATALASVAIAAMRGMRRRKR